MNRNALVPVLALSLLCGACAIAQDAPPVAPSSPRGTVPSPPRGGRMELHIQRGPQQESFRDIRSSEGGMFMGGKGMNPGSRIVPPGLWWKNPDTIQKLILTPDQQKRMDDTFQQSRLQLIDLKANVEKQEVILEPMLDANPPDTNKVLSQIDHVAQARAELEKANARMLLGIRGVLSADQWTKLQADRGRGNIILRFNDRRGNSNGQGMPDGILRRPPPAGGHSEVHLFRLTPDAAPESGLDLLD